MVKSYAFVFFILFFIQKNQFSLENIEKQTQKNVKVIMFETKPWKVFHASGAWLTVRFSNSSIARTTTVTQGTKNCLLRTLQYCVSLDDLQFVGPNSTCHTRFKFDMWKGVGSDDINHLRIADRRLHCVCASSCEDQSGNGCLTEVFVSALMPFSRQNMFSDLYEDDAAQFVDCHLEGAIW